MYNVIHYLFYRSGSPPYAVAEDSFSWNTVTAFCSILIASTDDTSVTCMHVVICYFHTHKQVQVLSNTQFNLYRH